MVGFIFDASQGESPKTLALKRALAAQIMGGIGNKPARNANEGIGNALASIGQGISANVLGRRADDAEKTGNAAADSAWNNAFTGGGGAGSTGTASAPVVAAAPSGLTAAAGAADAAPSASAAEIRAGLIARGLPDTVADGFVTNFQDESGLNPGINEKSPLVPGSRGGFGLAQWTGPRRVALEQFAQSAGRPADDMNTQLDFLVHELKGPEAKAAQSIFSTSTPQDAAIAVARDFLRPAQSNLDRRVARYAGMPDAGAQPPLAFSGEPQGSAPQLPPGMAAPAPIQTAALSDPQTMNDASPPGAFGGAPAQPAFSPFAPDWNRAPSQFRQPAPNMGAMPLGMMSGGAFSGDDQTGSLPPQAAPQPRSPFLPPVPPPAAPAPQAPAAPQPRSPFLPPQMTPASFEEAPGTLPGGGQVPPQMARATQSQPPDMGAPNLPTQTPNLQTASAQQPGQQQAGMGGADLPTLMKLASNPFIMANPGRAAVVKSLLEAKMKQQQQAADPVYQAQVAALPLDRRAKELAVQKAENDANGGEYQKRFDAAKRFGIDPNSSDGRQFVLTGKMPGTSDGNFKVVGNRLIHFDSAGNVTDATPPSVAKSAGGVNLESLPIVQVDQRGAPDPAAQQQFLKGLDPSVASLVKGIAEYRMPIEKVTSMRGNQRQELAQVVSQYDPTFDMSQYGARAAMRKSITSGNYSQVLNSSNLVIQHLDALGKAAEKLGNSSFTPWNTLVNEGKSITGNPDITAFNTARSAAAAELAKVFKGVGTSSLQEIQDWMHNISSSASPEQTKAMINMAVKDLLKSRIDTVRNQYSAAMGKPSEFTFLTPHSRDVLKGLGIDPSEIDTGAAPASPPAPSGGTTRSGLKWSVE